MYLSAEVEDDGRGGEAGRGSTRKREARRRRRAEQETRERREVVAKRKKRKAQMTESGMGRAPTRGQRRRERNGWREATSDGPSFMGPCVFPQPWPMAGHAAFASRSHGHLLLASFLSLGR